MKAVDAIRLRFVHQSCGDGRGPQEHCVGITHNGQRCNGDSAMQYHGFAFCRKHLAAVQRFIRDLVFEEKETSAHE